MGSIISTSLISMVSPLLDCLFDSSLGWRVVVLLFFSRRITWVISNPSHTWNLLLLTIHGWGDTINLWIKFFFSPEKWVYVVLLSSGIEFFCTCLVSFFPIDLFRFSLLEFHIILSLLLMLNNYIKIFPGFFLSTRCRCSFISGILPWEKVSLLSVLLCHLCQLVSKLSSRSISSLLLLLYFSPFKLCLVWFLSLIFSCIYFIALNIIFFLHCFVSHPSLLWILAPFFPFFFLLSYSFIVLPSSSNPLSSLSC